MTPVDVVKTRLMTGGATGGIVGTFTAILNDEGAATQCQTATNVNDRGAIVVAASA